MHALAMSSTSVQWRIMHHSSARAVISCVIGGSGFGEQALALCTAASLGDADPNSVRLRQAALNRASELPADPPGAYTGVILAAPIPSDEKDLCVQLAPLVIEHPEDTGMQLACLAGLCKLWPHVTSEERPLLRARFLAGLASRRMPPGSQLTSRQLVAWQRDLPTAYSNASASVSSLRAVLIATSARDAHVVMAEHLGISADLPTLAWVLGALTVQMRIQLHDRNRHLLHILMGSMACEQLAAWTPPELLATLLAQLAHQLWWCSNQAGLAPVRTCLDSVTRPLAEAVRSGDLTVAQRSARAACKQPAAFWETVWSLLDARIAANDPSWCEALELVLAIAARTGTDAVSPDDAAALGTLFADLAYREQLPTAALASPH